MRVSLLCIALLMTCAWGAIVEVEGDLGTCNLSRRMKLFYPYFYPYTEHERLVFQDSLADSGHELSEQ